MKTSIAKWGNSLAVRLPKTVSAELDLNAGAQLDLVVENGEIRLRKPRVVSSSDLLAEMIAEAKRLGPELEPETVDWGRDVGSEIIDDAYSRNEITLDELLRASKSSKRRGASRQRKR